MKKLVSILLSALMICASMCISYADDTVTPVGENVAKGKPVTVNTAHDWYPGSSLVDGNFSANGVDAGRWTVPYNALGASQVVYAIIDLGKPYNINALRGEIWWGSTSTKADAKVYGSRDGAEYTDLLGTFSGEGVQTLAVDNTKKYQYIKVTATDWPGMNWGMWELEVYGEFRVDLKGENVARAKNVAVSAAHDWYPGSRMVDGAFSEGGDAGRWTTPTSGTSGGKEVYAIVDLGKPYTINAIRGEIVWNDYSTKASAKIYASNDPDNFEVQLGTLVGEGKQAFEVVDTNKYQYIKVSGSDWTGMNWGMWELEVYSEDKVEPKGENVALKKPVTVTSEHTCGYYPADRVTNGGTSADGDRWCAYYPQGALSYDYAIIDLKKPYSINAIAVYMCPTYSSSSGEILVSNDNATWTPVGSVVAKTGMQAVEVDAANKWQYVKVQGKQISGGLFSLYEVEVYSEDKFELQGRNVAKGKIVTANSTHAYYSTKGLVDGYYSADGVDGGKWRTADGTVSGGSKVYAIIDLVMPYTINGIKGEIWYDGYSTKADAKVYGSYDGVEYNDLLATIGGEGVQIAEVLSKNKYRFIKVEGTDWPGMGWGVWELEVYSTDVFVPQGENVARGKDVVASNEHTEWYPANKLVDGNFSSAGYDGGRWTTNYGTGSGGQEVYAIIDLGKPYNINAFVGEIVWTGQSTKSNAKIYGSTDGVAFNDLLATISGEGVQTVPVTLSEKYQYIKVAGTDWPGMNWGMWELQIYSLDDYLECETTYVVSDSDMTAIDKIPVSGEFAVKVNYSTEGGARALTGYLVEYGSDNSMVDVLSVDILVGAGEKNGEMIVPVYITDKTNKFRFFVWDENNTPFTKAPAIEK